MRRPLRLLTIGHSYVVALNRRLVRELALRGGDRWEVHCIAPSYFHGSRDLRPVTFEPADDAAMVTPAAARMTSRVHVFTYGRPMRELLRQDWDIVHAWEEPFILAGGQIAWHTPKRSKLVIATFQNHAKRYPPPFNFIERYAMRRSAGWIAFGETIRHVLGDRPIYRDRPMRVIPPGVDIEHFRPDAAARAETRRRLGLGENDVVIGYLGRFIPEKGIDLLLRVAGQLSGNWRMMFVGAGPMEADLRAAAGRMGDRLRIVTGVKHDDVPAHLCAMDMLVAPSRTTPHWREQFGRMLIEAFACGVAVIGSDSGEIPHVIGDAGIVVGEKDEPGWRAAIQQFIDDADARRALAERGLERARTRFAWPVVAEAHLRFFEDLLGGAAAEARP
jgi:glycosyltransferase involved in cell wall biosynthesis